MASSTGGLVAASDVPSTSLDSRFDPATPLSLTVGFLPDPRYPIGPSLAEVPALILSLLGRTEPALSALEQRSLRACLRIAGEDLPVLGTFDAAFYEALLAFKARHGLEPVDVRLDLPTLTQIVSKAARAVGGPSGRGFLQRWRGIHFDVVVAPVLVAETPGITTLIRELKGNRTRMPTMAPVSSNQAG